MIHTNNCALIFNISASKIKNLVKKCFPLELVCQMTAMDRQRLAHHKYLLAQ